MYNDIIKLLNLEQFNIKIKKIEANNQKTSDLLAEKDAADAAGRHTAGGL